MQLGGLVVRNVATQKEGLGFKSQDWFGVFLCGVCLLSLFVSDFFSSHRLLRFQYSHFLWLLCFFPDTPVTTVFSSNSVLLRLLRFSTKTPGFSRYSGYSGFLRLLPCFLLCTTVFIDFNVLPVLLFYAFKCS